jgi:CBS domain-containing protein
MRTHVVDHLHALPSRDPVVIDPAATLRSAAHTMWLASVGLAIVGDVAHPRGVVSERDLVAALAQGADPDVVTAAQVMTSSMVSVRAHDPIYDVVGQMIDDGIRHVPIVDEGGTVLGMVSVRDVLQPLLLDALGGS